MAKMSKIAQRERSAKKPTTPLSSKPKVPAEILGYVPFSFDFPTEKLPDKSWFEKHHDDDWRRWVDSLELAQLHPLVFNLIASLVDRAEKQKPVWATIGLDLLIRQSLSALHYLALAERPGAAGTLAFVLREAVGRLNHPDVKNSKAMRNVARSELNWPIIYSPSKYYTTDTEALQGRLNIADDYFLKIRAPAGEKGQQRSFDFSIPKNQMVVRIIETLQANKYSVQREGSTGCLPDWVVESSRLKPFSSASVSSWAKVGWDAILDAYGGFPERDPVLRTIGIHRARRALLDNDQEAGESAIRNEIKAEILPALRKLANENYPWNPTDIRRIMPRQKSIRGSHKKPNT